MDASPIHYEWVAQMDGSNSSVVSLSSSAEHDDDHDHDHDHEHDHDHDHESHGENSVSDRKMTGYIMAAVIVPTFFFVLCGVFAALRHGGLHKKLQYISDSPPPSKDRRSLPQHPIIYESGSDFSQLE